MKNRVVLSCVFLALFVVLALVYALVILPEGEDEPAVTTAGEDLLDGEVEGAAGRVQMFDYVSTSEVSELYVHNANGEYRLVRKDGTLVVEGNEGLLIDSQKLTQMILNAGYTLSTFRSEVSEEDFSKYGLGDGESDAYFVLTTIAGKRYTVYIGDETLAGDGYYARYEGRNAIYVLDDAVEADLLGRLENLVRPLLAYPSSMDTYYLVRNFMISRGEEPFISVSYLNPEERSVLTAMSVHELSHPGVYPASYTYDEVLARFCEFLGSETVAIGTDEETLKKFGLDTPAYTLYFENAVMDDSGNPTGMISNYILFSEKQQDTSGNYYYYAAAPWFGIVARVEAVTVDFLEYELDRWVSPNVFQANITDIASIAFASEGQEVTFLLTGKDNDSLVITEKESGHSPETMNFRQLWKVLLSVTMDGTADLSESDLEVLTAGDDNLLLAMTVVTREGEEQVICFYPYTDRRVFYTVNGDGEFYVPRTLLDKVISDVGKIMRDEEVNADTRY